MPRRHPTIWLPATLEACSRDDRAMSERKPKRDERLSIPAPFEDAVRAIVKVKREAIPKPRKAPVAKVAKKAS